MKGLAERTRDKIVAYFGKDIAAMIQYFYPKEKALAMLDLKRWTRAVLELDKSIPQREAENLFRWCDINGSNSVSLVAFKYRFLTPEQRLRRDRESVSLPPHIISDIERLFRQLDLDKSGYLDFNELKMILGNFGVNVGAEEMREYVRRFDKNNDNQISFEEFRQIVEERIISEVLNVQDFVEDLRAEYQKCGTKDINVQQFFQLCKNLGAVYVTPEEASALFSEVDE